MIAPIPEAVATEATPPSSPATASSSERTVGLESLPYTKAPSGLLIPSAKTSGSSKTNPEVW
ncbi:hypothetical protein GCM10020219_082380 [Nonomuraea dietziae]